MTTIMWFRQDLRLADNPALLAAAARGPVLPIYILDDITPPERWRLGGASRWWLHHSLSALQQSLPSLVLMRGDPREILPRLARLPGVAAAFWNLCYEPWAIQNDAAIKSALEAQGTATATLNANLLNEPWRITNASGEPYRVFSAYWRAANRRSPGAPSQVPAVQRPEGSLPSERLEDWALTPRQPDWAAGWGDLWQPGEAGAQTRLRRFLSERASGYAELRSRMDLAVTSTLSPHLHWGEISPRQILAQLAATTKLSEADATKYTSEIGWREFAYHVLFHHPDLPDRHWREAFDAYPYREDAAALRAWQRGQTGYPIVDAGMRQLWQTGWMHNRARMITASFLVKHLRIDWRVGEAWFWDTLVDADLANNAMGWQWVTGSGADAAPYFRIFNPVTQGRKFDPEGTYIRTWCPELARLDAKDIHAPFEAPPALLAAAGVALGQTYPRPIVEHRPARAAALAAYEAVKRHGSRSAPSESE